MSVLCARFAASNPENVVRSTPEGGVTEAELPELARDYMRVECDFLVADQRSKEAIVVLRRQIADERERVRAIANRYDL